jgi:pyruvate dehydrogenase complex dehydrogenase (E1) component
MAIYQARFLKYLHARGIADTEKRKVWAFCGDGEMDEPESMGAIGMAGREQLNNLVIVVNCNLQRLDGPVRGNGKIIQELESDFRGAGWNVVKVIWGSGWDELLAKDKEGILQKVMMETVDGEYQNYKARDGAYVRAHFFGKHPKLLEMVSKMSDDDIWRLTRGGHDPHKIYAAYKVAQESTDKPTVILAKSIKGFGFGKSGEARNTAHNTRNSMMKRSKPCATASSCRSLTLICQPFLSTNQLTTRQKCNTCMRVVKRWGICRNAVRKRMKRWLCQHYRHSRRCWNPLLKAVKFPPLLRMSAF